MSDCYQRAWSLLSRMSSKQAKADAYLCHGAAVNTGDSPGERMGHAWVELGNTVFDYVEGELIKIDAATYYRVGKIAYVRRYPIKEAIKLAKSTGHYGPWDPEIQKLAHC